MDLERDRMGLLDRTAVAQDREQWMALVGTTLKLRVP
jgi:hypothetical protein